MKRIFLTLALVLPLCGTSGCAFTKSLETYNAKECEEIRKIAEQEFLSGRSDGSLRPNDNSEIADAFFRRHNKRSDIDRQALRLSYKNRCN